MSRVSPAGRENRAAALEFVLPPPESRTGVGRANKAPRKSVNELSIDWQTCAPLSWAEPLLRGEYILSGLALL